MAAISPRKALLVAFGVLAMSTCAMADGPTNGGQDPPNPPPAPPHAQLPDGIVDVLMQALPILVQTVL